MDVPRSIFRQYDVRGLVERELTPAFARSLGQAFGSAVYDRAGHPPAVAVGRDNRPSGAALAEGFREGVAAAGGTAIDVGMVPTPALYFAVHALHTDGGCQVTGSHNPPEFNGFKMVAAGEAMHGEAIVALWETIVAERWRSGAGRQTSDASILGKYRDAIVSIANKSDEAIPTPVAIVGIPGGLEVRHDQLKELVKSGRIDAYEVIGREVVLYWRALKAKDKFDLPLSLVAAVPGTYTGPASRAYLYYTDEYKSWAPGLSVTIAAR